MSNKKRTLCVDCNYLLKQSHHGNNRFEEKYGHVGAVDTFLAITRKMIKEQDITKVILFWDGLNAGKMRYRIYPYYKSNRHKSWFDDDIILTSADIRKIEWLNKQKDEEAILLVQKIRIQQYAEELFFRQYEFPEIESDDAIAFYCKNIKEEDEEVIIYTNDQDFLQLLNIDNVFIYLSNKKDLINKYNFNILYFNYHYSNTGLIKAIEGCKSDVIHGVDGVGEKTLLKYFPELKDRPVTFDEIYNKAKEINKKRKKPLKALENLIEGKTSVNVDSVLNGEHLFKLNYKLVNLLEPMITDEAIEVLETQTLSPLDIEDRGGKNIIRLMFEDGLINRIPNGSDGYKDFLIPFLPVVNSEKNYTKSF